MIFHYLWLNINVWLISITYYNSHMDILHFSWLQLSSSACNQLTVISLIEVCSPIYPLITIRTPRVFYTILVIFRISTYATFTQLGWNRVTALGAIGAQYQLHLASIKHRQARGVLHYPTWTSSYSQVLLV